MNEALETLYRKALEWTEGPLQDDVLLVGFEQPSRAQDPIEISLIIDSTSEQVDVACYRLRAFLEAPEFGLRLSSKLTFDLLLAVREALMNGVVHGNRGKPEAKLRLECWRERNSKLIHLAVVDEGDGFELEAASGPPESPSGARFYERELAERHEEQRAHRQT